MVKAGSLGLSELMHLLPTWNPRKGKKQGQPYRHIIAIVVRDGREWHLHATKGWRSYRRYS